MVCVCVCVWEERVTYLDNSEDAERLFDPSCLSSIIAALCLIVTSGATLKFV